MQSGINFYGVLERTIVETALDLVIEEVTRLGYSIIHSGFSENEIQTLADNFDKVYDNYILQHGYDYLKTRDEHNGVRLPLALDPSFLELAKNENLLSAIRRLIAGKFILNQQNAITNPVNSRYNQDSWHRDLPYQHFISSRPIAVNALYCVDDFTKENGATCVLPATHLMEEFPSDQFIEKHTQQIIAPAGSFIIINCMTYHRGAKNQTERARRAINHVFTIPYIKQQISIPSVMRDHTLDETTKDLLGMAYSPPDNVSDFLSMSKEKY